MTSKHLAFRNEAREKLLHFATVLAGEESRFGGDERTGVRILKRALEAPTRQIAENSATDRGVVVGETRSGHGAFGFDAATGKYVDLMEAGIVDPVKVVRLAPENAVSVAGVLLLTEATVTELPEAKAERHLFPPFGRRIRLGRAPAARPGNDHERLE